MSLEPITLQMYIGEFEVERGSSREPLVNMPHYVHDKLRIYKVPETNVKGELSILSCKSSFWEDVLKNYLKGSGKYVLEKKTEESIIPLLINNILKQKDEVVEGGSIGYIKIPKKFLNENKASILYNYCISIDDKNFIVPVNTKWLNKRIEETIKEYFSKKPIIVKINFTNNDELLITIPYSFHLLEEGKYLCLIKIPLYQIFKNIETKQTLYLKPNYL
ncbi:MAG: hypothetical protein QXL97_00915 [Candidatus Aenigmatarchaeota archaeon]